MTSSFILISSFLVIFLLIIIFMVAYQPKANLEKKESFECGFNSITKNKASFSTKFFLIMILFLVFDLEVAILLPACMKQGSLFHSMMMSMTFIIFLTIAMILEWMNGMIEWSS